MTEADILVIGAGIAGASIAAHLARTRNVVILEREQHAGYHSTGRSAALFSETYGNPPIRALTRASRAFFLEPPDGFAHGPLARSRGSLSIAGPSQLDALHAFASLPDIGPLTRRIEPSAARRLCPILREEAVAGALLEPGSTDLDVQELHQGYLRSLRSRKGRLIPNADVQGISHAHGKWTVHAAAQEWTAPVLVNAAGAWADEIARLAGVAPVGLVPCRRTAILVEPPPGLPIGAWPMVIDIEEQFYFKPEAGLLLISPADETPSAPTDAYPEDWDVAVAIDRMQSATTLEIQRPKSSWAGLRSFTPDRSPVVGYSGVAEGFFWLAGQGGYGIQTAPALSRAAAALVIDEALPEDLLREGFRAEDLAPARFEGKSPVRAANPTEG